MCMVCLQWMQKLKSVESHEIVSESNFLGSGSGTCSMCMDGEHVI